MLNLPFFRKQNKIKPYVLLILDGFGVAPPSNGNAITLAKTPNYLKLVKSFPNSLLIASGESVGLPANEVGNTEVGHLTLGAGRVILQDLKRINYAIEKGTFYDNKAFVEAANHTKRFSSNMHLFSLVSSGNVHSSLSHLFALLQFCKKEGLKNVHLHLFTDGRDAPPREGLQIIGKIENQIRLLGVGKITSVSGRYFAMDRDKRWDRTERTYKALVLGKASVFATAEELIKNAYSKDQTDEFIEPSLVGTANKSELICDNDAIIFVNYRIDRPRQLTMAFTLPNFESLSKFDFGSDPDTNKIEKNVNIGNTFLREKILNNLFFATMTQYQKDLPAKVAFPAEKVPKALTEVLSKSNLTHLHMSESEKERFVTYYFNGLREEKFEGEEFKIIESPKVSTYDKKPEMSLPKLYKEFKNALLADRFNFFVVNFANCDMVAHSGNLAASIKATEIVDYYLGQFVSLVLEASGTIFITADHGNCEELISYPSSTYFYTTNKGTINTDHSNYPVPFIVVDKRFLGVAATLEKGGLADVAPTILTMMGIAKPEEMTGKNLLDLRK